jgi:DNA-binding transcriptional MocR family regulator
MLPPGARDWDIAVRAAQSGISVVPLSSCYAGAAREPGLVLGYGSTRARQMGEAVRKLKAVLE